MNVPVSKRFIDAIKSSSHRALWLINFRRFSAGGPGPIGLGAGLAHQGKQSVILAWVYTQSSIRTELRFDESVGREPHYPDEVDSSPVHWMSSSESM
jgi:hypothetical protein